MLTNQPLNVLTPLSLLSLLLYLSNTAKSGYYEYEFTGYTTGYSKANSPTKPNTSTTIASATTDARATYGQHVESGRLRQKNI